MLTERQFTLMANRVLKVLRDERFTDNGWIDETSLISAAEIPDEADTPATILTDVFAHLTRRTGYEVEEMRDPEDPTNTDWYRLVPKPYEDVSPEVGFPG